MATEERPMAEEVRASKFTLVGKDGRTCASLFVDEQDLPVIALMDERGKTRVRVFVDSNGHGAALQFFDADGEETVAVREHARQPFFALGDDNVSIFLQAKAQGPMVEFSDEPDVRIAGVQQAADP